MLRMYSPVGVGDRHPVRAGVVGLSQHRLGGWRDRDDDVGGGDWLAAAVARDASLNDVWPARRLRQAGGGEAQQQTDAGESHGGAASGGDQLRD